jgi:hypothetical protein
MTDMTGVVTGSIFCRYCFEPRCFVGTPGEGCMLSAKKISLKANSSAQENLRARGDAINQKETCTQEMAVVQGGKLSAKRNLIQTLAGDLKFVCLRFFLSRKKNVTSKFFGIWIAGSLRYWTVLFFFGDSRVEVRRRQTPTAN